MAKGEINLLNTEINKLLNDICKFLNEELSNGFLSPQGKSLATTLIERSKQQLHAISISLKSSDCNNESYVDMHGYKPKQEPEHQEVYSDVSLVYEGTSGSSIVEDDHTFPYKNLPATELEHGKVGSLYRKEKVLFFEQHKKIFAAVQQSYLLLYMNETARKPCQIFDLTHYKANPSPPSFKDVKRRNEAFELVSDTDLKSCHFIAETSKDMLQWVRAINSHADVITTKRNLPPVPSNLSFNENRISTESENNYEQLKNYQLNTTSNNFQDDNKNYNTNTIKKEPLPLPPRNLTLQHTKKSSSEESLSSNYDSVGPGVTRSSPSISNSFSEEDSDQHYDNPTELRQHNSNLATTLNKDTNRKVSTRNNSNNMNDEIYENYKEEDDDDNDDKLYDYLEKPNTNSNYKKYFDQNIQKQTKVDKKKPTESEVRNPKLNIKKKFFL